MVRPYGAGPVICIGLSSEEGVLKGGVGKNTSAIGTAEALARLGHTVTARDADPSGAATLWAHKALSAGRPLPFGVEVVSRFTVAAPAEEESWRSTSR